MAEVLHGAAAGDQLNASVNKTQVYGLQGNDTLTSNGKSDVLLIGGSGDDSLVIKGGNVTLSGGDGSDVFELNYSATEKLSAVIEDLNPTRDKIVVNFDGETVPQLTSVTSGSDVIWRDGDLLTVTLKGIRDNDYYDGEASQEIWDVLKFTNAERENQNLSPLTLSEGLNAGASIRAEEITELGQGGVLTDHTRPNGTPYYTVLDNKYSNVGENLDGGAISAQQVVKDWMNSPGHRANILNSSFKKLGVGYNYYDADPTDHRFYWTQMFAESVAASEMTTVSTENLLSANITTDIVSRFVELTDAPNNYANTTYGATISALGGDDTVTNTNLNVSISGGADNDSIVNSSAFATINAGTGNDTISLSSDAKENLILYATGDGNDTVRGFGDDDTLKILGDEEYTPVTVGNDVRLAVGNASVTLVDAAAIDSLNIDGIRSKLYILTDEPNTLSNTVEGATIQALGGNDSISNASSNVTIDAGAGDDTLVNSGENVLFICESGKTTIDGFDATSTLKVASGDYSSVTFGYDLFLTGASEIQLLGAASLDNINIVGANDSEPIGDAKNIVGTERADSIPNTIHSATIQALGGDDTVTNSGIGVSILGGTGNDSIVNEGGGVIDGGDGDDTVDNKGDVNFDGSFIKVGTGNNVIYNNQRRYTHYTYEGGNDVIYGFNDMDRIIIIGNYTWETVKSGADVIVNISRPYLGTVGTITLKDYTDSDVQINSSYTPTSESGTEISNTLSSVSVLGTASNDDLSNKGNDVTIAGFAGRDDIDNYGTSVTIDGGAGNDDIRNFNALVSIDGGEGNDYILTEGTDVTINGGDNSDTINNIGSNAIVDGGAGNDYLYTDGSNVTINGGDGDDYISNYESNSNVSMNGGNGSDYIFNYEGSSNISIDAGAGSDSVWSYGTNVTIDAGADNDVIFATVGSNISIDAGAGDDTLWNYSDRVTIGGGNGVDSIMNVGSDVSIAGGSGADLIDSNGLRVTIAGNAGDDQISLGAAASNNVIQFSEGDGNDIVWGLGEDDTVNILADSYSTVGSEDDLIINVGNSSITLKNSRYKPPHIIINASDSAGGTSGNDNGNGHGSHSGDAGDSGKDNSGTNSSQGNSQADSDGRSTSGTGNTSGGGRSRDGGGGSVRTATSTRPGYTDVVPTSAPTFPTTTPTSIATTPSALNTYVYTGGDMVISTYKHGEKIIFGEIYTGAFYDAAGNLIVGSSTGALAVTNATGKVVDLVDAAGNAFVKTYSAPTAGIIDGRGLNGFELINGSAGSDIIQAGDGGSQLWGGNDSVTDALIGGNGTDIFVTGKSFGADAILNSATNDLVNFADSTLSDIVATAGDGNSVEIRFNTGNVVTVQSTNELSAAVLLADGSAWRFNHSTKSWQTA